MTTNKLPIFICLLSFLDAVRCLEFVDEYTDYFNLTSITNYTSCKTALRSNEYFGFEGFAQLPIIDGYRFHEEIVVYKAGGDCDQNLAVMRKYMLCLINISRSGCAGSSPGHKPREGCYCNYAKGRHFFFTINKTAVNVVKHHQLCVNHPRSDVEYLGSIPLPAILYNEIPVAISVNDEEMNLTQCRFETKNAIVSLHFCTEYLINPKLTIAVGKQTVSEMGSCIHSEMTLSKLKQTATFKYAGDCGQEGTHSCELVLADPSVVDTPPDDDTPTYFFFTLPRLEYVIGSGVGGVLLLIFICYVACCSPCCFGKKVQKTEKRK
ncbi:hypothetical protein Btru_071723 [Bulinus truncatus]|nr:hypothetical protein Btru_071723 [Bulinus truncatus]